MGYSGMNAAVVERVSRDLHTCSMRLNTIVSTVDSIVTRTQEAWIGADARRFATDWHADRSTLSGLSGSLDSLARKANAEAAEQRRTSGN